MKKENDLVLNMLANQNFTVSDFKAVGLTSENTNLLPEEKYKASEKITSNPLFQTNGEFDEAKFLQEFERVKYKNNVTKAIPLPIILRSS